MKKWQLVLIALFLAVFSWGTAQTADASEGVIEMHSTLHPDGRCYGLSIFMIDAHFHVLVTCRNLVYPPHPLALNFILWAMPAEGGKPIRLAELGSGGGKGEVRVRSAFTSPFVTRELDRNTREPTGDVVMRGDLKPITFFGAPLPTATPEAQTPDGEEKTEETEIPGVKEEKKGFSLLTGSIFIIITGAIGLGFLVYMAFKKS